MRTTVDLDKRLLARVRARAEHAGLTVSQWLERAARRELDEASTKKPRAFRLITAGEGGLRPGFTWSHLDEQTEPSGGGR
ncbi:MAG: hypothetical protein JNJ54_11285 [Myxococcaceae bacterium]|nr:hypothetical protein [Myxococcaceae bacterium]